MMLVPTITAVSCIFIILFTPTETGDTVVTDRTLIISNVKWGKPEFILNTCNGGSSTVHFSTTVENHSDTPQSVERTFGLEFEQSMSWSKIDSIAVGTPVKLDDQIPIEELGVPVSATLTKQTSWTEGKVKTVTFEDSITIQPTVPARSKRTTEVTLTQVEIRLPFKGILRTQVTGNEDRLATWAIWDIIGRLGLGAIFCDIIDGYMILNTLSKGSHSVKYGKTMPLPDNLTTLPGILPTPSRVSMPFRALDQCNASFSASVTGKMVECTASMLSTAPVKYGMMVLSTIFFIILF